MSKAVRMADIAERLGVSTVTVSKALADKEGVGEEMRAKIKELAIEMGYKTTGAGPKPRKTGTGNIGVLISGKFLGQAESFYWDMYQRVVTRLLENNYYGILEVLQADGEEKRILPRLLQDEKADGLIVIGQLSKEYLAYLQTFDKIPMMFLDSYMSSCGQSSIISDGYYGMYAMTNYLLGIGHTDIHFVGTPSATSSISDRYFGYCRAMSEHGLAVTDDMVLPDRDQNGEVHVTLPGRLPTAFACNCDYTAYELMTLLKENNISVPEDISIVGFDNYALSNVSTPAITTYAVDMDGMARSCVERLIRKIHNPNYNPNLKVVSGRIIVKDSVAPPASKAE